MEPVTSDNDDGPPEVVDVPDEDQDDSMQSTSPSPRTKRRKAELDLLRSKQGKSSRVSSRMTGNETGFYEEKGAFAETYKKKNMTADELAVDMKLCNNPLSMEDIAATNQKILIQLSKYLIPITVFVHLSSVL